MKHLIASTLLLAACSPLGLTAQVSQTEADRLGQDLTPLGAERAGNAAGTIPAWEGGITTPPAGYRPGAHHPDPFGDDQPLYTITAQNLAEHAAVVTAGHAALLQTYPSYKLAVYPTRRSAARRLA